MATDYLEVVVLPTDYLVEVVRATVLASGPLSHQCFSSQSLRGVELAYC